MKILNSSVTAFMSSILGINSLALVSLMTTAKTGSLSERCEKSILVLMSESDEVIESQHQIFETRRAC